MNTTSATNTTSTIINNSVNSVSFTKAITNVGSNTNIDIIPHQLSRLDAFVPSTKRIEPGHYLVFVFGDNYIGKSSFRIVPICLRNTEIISVCTERSMPAITNEIYDNIEENDKLVLQLKDEMNSLKKEYHNVKQAYETCIEKVKVLSTRVEQQLDKRDSAYKQLFMNSLQLKNNQFYNTNNTTTTRTSNNTTTSTTTANNNTKAIMDSTLVLASVPTIVPNRKRIQINSPTTTRITTTVNNTNNPNTSTNTTNNIINNNNNNPSTGLTSFASVRSTATAATGWFSKTISCKLN